MGTSKINADPLERLSISWVRSSESAQIVLLWLYRRSCVYFYPLYFAVCWRHLSLGFVHCTGCYWLVFARCSVSTYISEPLLLALLWVDSGTVRSCDHSSGIFCAAVRFHLYVENPYICRWIYFGLIPALSVNTTVHSVVSVAAGSYDRHRHIYCSSDFAPATGTA